MYNTDLARVYKDNTENMRELKYKIMKFKLLVGWQIAHLLLFFI